MNDTDIFRIFTETIEAHALIDAGAGVLAAVSGGADSVCLLALLVRYAETHDIRLAAAHYNHRLRGAESDRDAAFVRRLADSFGVTLYCGAGDVRGFAERTGTGLEEAARACRYGFLTDTARACGADVIAVAHNRDDNAETVLMHFLRGGALDGISGMSYRRDNIIRPLLDIDRRAIEAYLAARGLEFVTDSTNADTAYLRNRVRLEIMPYLAAQLGYDPAPVLVRSAAIAAEEREYLDGAAREFLEAHAQPGTAGGVRCDAEALAAAPAALRRRALRLLLAEVRAADGSLVYGGRKDIVYGAVERAEALVCAGRKGARADCGKGVTALLTHDGLELFVPFPHAPENAPGLPELTVRELGAEEIAARLAGGGFEAGDRAVFFDKAKYFSIIEQSGQSACEYRLRRPGDRVVPFGMRGHKKVQKLFIDLGVASTVRGTLPVLAAGSEVLWIPGVVSSELMRITDAGDGVLEFSIKEGNN